MNPSETNRSFAMLIQRPYNAVGVRKITSWICLTGLSIGAMLLGSTAFSSIPYILSFSVVDDSFYYLLPAYHATHGQALAFDGINTTNGFNPLWMATLLPIASLADNREVLLRLTLAYQALLYCTAAWLLVRAALRRGHLFLALLTTLLWIVFGLRRDLTFSFVTNGLESALFFLMLAPAFLITLQAIEGDKKAIRIFHPITMALLVLARLDALFFALPLSLYLVWAESRQRTVSATIRNFLPGWAMGGLLLLAYVAWNLYSVGVPLPVSGSLKMFHIRELAVSQFGGLLTTGHVLKVIETFWRSLSLIVSLVIGALLPVDTSNSLRAYLVNHVMFEPSAASLVKSALFFVFLAVGLLVAYKRGMRRRLTPWQTVTLLFGVGALLHLTFHSVTLWLYAYYNVWHYVGEIFALLMLATWIAASLLYRIWLWRRAFAIATMMLILVASAYVQKGAVRHQIESVTIPYPWPPSERSGIYRAVHWTNAHLPVETHLGAWNAGVAGYFAANPVTNLDGLINGRDLYQRLLRRTPIEEYIVQQELAYLVDYAPGGAWPTPEVGGIHYLDLYAERSAAFVMDTAALQNPAAVEHERQPTAWLVDVRTNSGLIEQWIGVAWPLSLADNGRWRIVDDQHQIIAGPFDVAPSWLPEVPPPPRTQHQILTYQPLPERLTTTKLLIQVNTNAEPWNDEAVAELNWVRH